jgi:uncharacterized cupin superfamily protein
MVIRRASLESINPQVLPGRTLRWLVTSETLGAERMSIAIMECPPGSVLRPMHSHIDIEEVILVLEGKGEALIDGDVTPFQKGDAVLFPSGSKHMLRNNGTEMLVTASIFSPPTSPAEYVKYEGEGW